MLCHCSASVATHSTQVHSPTHTPHTQSHHLPATPTRVPGELGDGSSRAEGVLLGHPAGMGGFMELEGPIPLAKLEGARAGPGFQDRDLEQAVWASAR